MNKRYSKIVCGGLLLSVFMVIGTACSSSGNQVDGDPSETIKIGMTSALTGPYSEYGEGNKRGVELAIQKWNDDGGINGKTIEVEILDDQLVPDTAAINLQQLLDDEEIVAIIGPAGSGPAMATVPITEANGMIHINPVAQTPEITYPNGTDHGPRKNVFSFALQNDVESEVLGSFAGEKWNKIGLIHESTAYGKTGMDLVEGVLEDKFSIEAVAREEYNQKAPDMTAQLAKLKKAGAEVIVCVGLGADLANIRKGMSRLDMNIPLVATNGALSLPYKEGAGDLVVGTIGTMIGVFGDDPLSPEAEEFAEAYSEAYGKDRYWGDRDNPQLFMSLSVSNGYDAANVLFEAIKNADSTESSKIIEAMENIQNLNGVNASYSFSETKHHAIDIEHIGLFEYVKEGDEIILVPYEK
ncbi:ABC transporter substrate-binding protein [Jeotgalibacillus soli]|uniref:Leu/Ile/val-binding protein n=1 Tax=Jeotgalibacillus soli TaxID=889306 RepID=A0A0C2VN23_9BACL|nr:ABC transporter substrate-binding protein [Jeotgalibacillus soli]KIL45403.1 leu/Ile/val-binding protein precursor [Jeotgalibacillus soli]